MGKHFKYILHGLLLIGLTNCMNMPKLNIDVFETSANGNKLTKITKFQKADSTVKVSLMPSINRSEPYSLTYSCAFSINKIIQLIKIILF